jgi:hypothetical protein
MQQIWRRTSSALLLLRLRLRFLSLLFLYFSFSQFTNLFSFNAYIPLPQFVNAPLHCYKQHITCTLYPTCTQNLAINQCCSIRSTVGFKPSYSSTLLYSKTLCINEMKQSLSSTVITVHFAVCFLLTLCIIRVDAPSVCQALQRCNSKIDLACMNFLFFSLYKPVRSLDVIAAQTSHGQAYRCCCYSPCAPRVYSPTYAISNAYLNQ